MLRLLTTLTTHTWSKHPKKKCGTKITISPNVLIISLRAISWMLLLIINYHTETRTSTQMTFNSVLHLEGHECAHWQGRTLLQQWSNFRQMSSTMPPMNGTVLSENQTRVAHQPLLLLLAASTHDNAELHQTLFRRCRVADGHWRAVTTATVSVPAISINDLIQSPTPVVTVTHQLL